MGLYRSPAAPLNKMEESYLITVFDGTGSMFEEYEIAVKAYEKVFKAYKKRKEYQMTSHGLMNLLPFHKSSYANITDTFRDIFKELLLGGKEKYGKKLSILFISDGQEAYDFDDVKTLIANMKENFEIQFFCISVGSGFPTEITSKLRTLTQNIIETRNTPKFIFKNISRPCNQIEAEFGQTFQTISDKHLKFCQEIIDLKTPVYIDGISDPTYKITFDVVFGCFAPQVESKDGQIFKPSNDPKDGEAFVLKCTEQVLVKGGEQQDFQKVKERIDKLFSYHSSQLYDANNKIKEVRELINQGAYGQLKYKELNDEDKKLLLISIHDAKVNVQQVFSNIKQKENQEEMKNLKQQFIKQMMSKLQALLDE